MTVTHGCGGIVKERCMDARKRRLFAVPVSSALLSISGRRRQDGRRRR